MWDTPRPSPYRLQSGTEKVDVKSLEVTHSNSSLVFDWLVCFSPLSLPSAKRILKLGAILNAQSLGGGGALFRTTSLATCNIFEETNTRPWKYSQLERIFFSFFRGETVFKCAVNLFVFLFCYLVFNFDVSATVYF